MGHDFLSLLLLPFRFTFHPANFLNGAGGVGVALLCLAPLGLLIKRRDLFVKTLTLFLCLQTLAWFYTEQEARFLIHAYVILACFAIWGWSCASEEGARLGSMLARLSVAVSLLYGLALMVPARAADMHATLSTSFEEIRRVREVPFLDSFQYLNENSAVKGVLVLEPDAAQLLDHSS